MQEEKWRVAGMAQTCVAEDSGGKKSSMDERTICQCDDGQTSADKSVPQALAVRIAKLPDFEYEAAWVRRKLGLPPDAPSHEVYGALHVWDSRQGGYMRYIDTYKCIDKDGIIARLTTGLHLVLDLLPWQKDGHVCDLGTPWGSYRYVEENGKWHTKGGLNNLTATDLASEQYARIEIFNTIVHDFLHSTPTKAQLIEKVVPSDFNFRALDMDLFKALLAARDALARYKNGNAGPDLAHEVCIKLNEILQRPTKPA